MSQASESNRRRWIEIISRQRADGLGVHSFCRREGLAPSTFFAWRRRLGETPRSDDPGVVARDGGRRDHAGGTAFVEVVEASEIARSCGAGVTASGVEVCLGNGLRIGVARSFDQETLCRVLAVLEQMPALPSAEQATARGKERA